MAIRERRIQEKERVKCERRVHAPHLSSFFTKSERMRPFAASAQPVVGLLRSFACLSGCQVVLDLVENLF